MISGDNIMENKQFIDDYIKFAKEDIKFYFLVGIVVFIVLLIFSYIVNFYYLLILIIFHLLLYVGKINAYNNLKKFKTYAITNNLTDELNNIEYFNQENYILTLNGVFIIKKTKACYFRYDDIKEIYKKSEYTPKVHSWDENLHIVLKNNDEYSILIFSTALVNEEFRDITNYLLDKNPKILFKK